MKAEHGGEVYALARSLRIDPEKLTDFSSNANIFAYDLTEALVRSTPYPFLHYPDTRAAALVEALAAHEEVEEERILPGNGGAELIWLAMQALAPQKVLFVGPIFSEYVAACNALNIPYEILATSPEHDFSCTPQDLQRLWETNADLVVLCTPNNPAAVTYGNIHPLLHMLRAPRVLIDNSYREFLFGSDEYAANHITAYAASARPGVSILTLHSMTKFFCCPGIRLGYLMGERTLLARLAARRPSWTVSPFAQVMGQAFLAHVDAYRERLAPLYAAVRHMGRELQQLACINPEAVFEGPGFLCCGLAARLDAGKVCTALLKRRLVVRNCDTIPGMPRGFIRLQARPEQDVAELLAVLESFPHNLLKPS